MQNIYRVLFIGSAILISNISFGQDSSRTKSLNEVVVTGQYRPQTLKNSVYSVHIINSDRIKLSGATNIHQVLNTQLGIRFGGADQFLGTDIKINGMSGRNVKILLDGVPVLDRFDARVSLSQIDINSIDHIEVVEGPMSVSYGTDAMAGLINIITKNNAHALFISAKAQEETTGTEYYPFSWQGMHTQNINIGGYKNGLSFNAGGTHNEFDGFGGDKFGRGKTWLPKEQWLGNVKIGYHKTGFNIYYRLDVVKEIITDRNTATIDVDANLAEALDQKFSTGKYMHQLQSSYAFNNRAHLSSFLAYTDFTRTTESTERDFVLHTAIPGIAEGQQDISKLNSLAFKNTFDYKISEKVSIQPGTDINHEKASGERITGKPEINDYAAFISAEYKPTAKINIRPGVRFEKNSVYHAPPAIPSLNTKFILNNQLDLRLSYGRGFRAPELRELYFYFIDANHDIIGNPNLRAETSNSLNGSLTWTTPKLKHINFSSTLSGFYNAFKNQINLLQIAPPNGKEYSYFNIDRVKTIGFKILNSISGKTFSATVGFSYTGFDQEFDASYVKTDKRDFLWSPEFTTDLIYRLKKINTSFGLFYKYTGHEPAFSLSSITSSVTAVKLTGTDAYNYADFTVTKPLLRYFTLSAGVKNIFNVTDVNNTTISSSNTQHNTGGPLVSGYGRSYFAGLIFQWNKK